MKFEIKNISKSINEIMRTIGYTPAYFQNDGEFSVIRKLSGGEYPRFHLYIEEAKNYKLEAKSYVFNLHLDQKKPSYKGHTGHSGEYEGEVVEREAQRIQQLLNAN